MKRAILSLLAIGAFVSAKAEIEILYLAPNDTSPVLGSISSDSAAYKSAQPVEGKNDWMKIVREDYYSGFIAKDSLTQEGTVEIGTAMLLTPSKTGKVLTTIEAGDDVSINLVDDWTEITVFKAIPGYFIPADRKVTPPAGAVSTSGRTTYARDPMLTQAGQTRYTPPSVSNSYAATSGPVAALPTIPTSDPMTGFEEVDSLNPSFGRTDDSGQTKGYTLGAGSTPIPRRDTTAPLLDASMQDPTSVAAIPIPTLADMDPDIEAPTQAEEVDVLSENENAEIEGTAPDDAAEDYAADELSDESEVSTSMDEETQEGALEDIDAGTEAMVAAEGDPSDVSEVIPLAPAAVVAGTTTAAAATTTPSAKEPEEPIEASPAVIIETTDDVEVANDVAESVVPGVTQPIAEAEPPLIPPTDTNRIYIGKLERTKAGFFSSKPKHDFELLNYSGERIAFVDLAEIPLSSYEKFTNRIVQVYGVLVPSGEKDTLLIKAANITLR